MLIAFCPWCGSKLPKSKRDLWFRKLEALGFSDPWSRKVPKKFQSEAWFSEKK